MPTCVLVLYGDLHLGVLGVSVAQTVTVDPVGVVTVVEGSNLTITCTDGGAYIGNDFFLHENGVLLTGSSQPPTQRNGTTRIFHLPVDRAKNGNTYRCEDVIAAMMSAVLTLTVTCERRVGSGYVNSYYSLA